MTYDMNNYKRKYEKKTQDTLFMKELGGFPL